MSFVMLQCKVGKKIHNFLSSAFLRIIFAWSLLLPSSFLKLRKPEFFCHLNISGILVEDKWQYTLMLLSSVSEMLAYIYEYVNTVVDSGSDSTTFLVSLKEAS